ncbi:cytochrome b [Dyella amyloliquefaciens]|uniref:cytochrome b n=1 Tax=Dyella amyloliquefaciens TaxID=1770545 RepID=UPI00102E912B|nr:cytochrome b [Dyella amyloliquefaciens]
MSAARYTPWMRRFHWAIAWFIVFALVLIEVKGWFPRGSASRTAVKWGHMQFGIAVLLLMVPRLLVRLRHAAPPITPEPPRWQALLSKLVHLALYLLAFAVPLLGVTMMFIAGKPWNLLGLPLPVLATPNPDLAHAIEDIHETIGNVLMWLAIAHVAAALFHHFVQRDDTLLRMLPGKRNRFR